MAIISNEGGVPPARGGILGGVSQQRDGGSWVRNSASGSPKALRRNYTGGRDFRPAQAAWALLAGSFKDEWNDAAATLPLYDRYTAPQLTTGEQLFLSYNTNLLFYGQGGSFVDSPPSPPTWGPVGAFQGKLDKDGNNTMAIVSAAFEAGTILAVYGQPPGRSNIRLLRSQMRYLGNVTFPSGLTVGSLDLSIGALYEAHYGASVQEFETNLWTMLYQLEGGFVRLVGDPCFTDDGLARMVVTPTGNPTSTSQSLGPGSRWLFNNGLPSQVFVFADAWGPIHPGETAITKVALPYPASQIVTVHAVVVNVPPSGQFKLGTGGPRVWNFTYNLP